MARLPQLTPLGTVFAYNNAAVALAGRVLEAATGSTYERAVRDLLLEPLGLTHSRFFSDEIVGFNVAASHAVVDGQPVVAPAFWHVPRSLHPTGGLISSARDQLQYARFHLGDGTAPDGTRLLREASLVAMRSDPGPAARDVDAPAPAPRPRADRSRAHRPGVSPGLLPRRLCARA
jgi:CubicO group peptidase (beta-lactamase class C family)